MVRVTDFHKGLVLSMHLLIARAQSAVFIAEDQIFHAIAEHQPAYGTAGRACAVDDNLDILFFAAE